MEQRTLVSRFQWKCKLKCVANYFVIYEQMFLPFTKAYKIQYDNNAQCSHNKSTPLLLAETEVKSNVASRRQMTRHKIMACNRISVHIEGSALALSSLTPSVGNGKAAYKYAMRPPTNAPPFTFFTGCILQPGCQIRRHGKGATNKTHATNGRSYEPLESVCL